MSPVLIVAGLLLAAPPSNVVRVSAKIAADALEVGQTYELVISVNLRPGWSASDSGIAQPLLQISLPDSVEPTQPVMTSYQQLSQNEFLSAPFERMVTGKTERVEFKLLRQPSPEDRIAFSILAYVGQKDSDDAWFVRKRYEVAIEPGAKARKASTDVSDWGIGDELQIGDKAAAFELPQADGSIVSLAKYLGKKNIVITTYRAFW